MHWSYDLSHRGITSVPTQAKRLSLITALHGGVKHATSKPGALAAVHYRDTTLSFFCVDAVMLLNGVGMTLQHHWREERAHVRAQRVPNSACAPGVHVAAPAA